MSNERTYGLSGFPLWKVREAAKHGPIPPLVAEHLVEHIDALSSSLEAAQAERREAVEAMAAQRDAAMCRYVAAEAEVGRLKDLNTYREMVTEMEQLKAANDVLYRDMRDAQVSLSAERSRRERAEARLDWIKSHIPEAMILSNAYIDAALNPRTEGEGS